MEVDFEVLEVLCAQVMPSVAQLLLLPAYQDFNLLYLPFSLKVNSIVTVCLQFSYLCLIHSLELQSHEEM